MSKSPNLLIPGLGITALVLGLGYGAASRHYGADKIAMLEDRVATIEAQKSAAVAAAGEIEAQLIEVQAAAASATVNAPAPALERRLGLGRDALPEEIAAWDVDVLPDGRGLPEGSGDVWTGEEVFAEACASCHGDFAEGVDNWPPLAGGFDTLADKDPVKTVGSYWPYLSTVWDYVHRSMPFGAAQTLSDDEVYAIVAYILYSNDLVDEDFTLSHETFAEVEMPNAGGFVVDDRPAQEYVAWRGTPCMENCKESVEITMRASVLDVTPEDAVVHETAAQAPAAIAPTTPATAMPAAFDAGLAAEGEAVFRKCKACHQVGEGAQNRTGPHLNGIMGRPFAAADGFSYSTVFEEAGAEGRVWDAAAMAEFLAKPKAYMQGTKMAFAGLRSDADIAAVTEYLKSVGN